jgi:hypothetical protein
MPSKIVSSGLPSAFLVLIPVLTLAEEPVTVYVKSPVEIAEQQNLEAVLRELPLQRSKWTAFSDSNVTYVVTQKSVGLLTPDPCEGLPIRVKISHGRLQSAVYDSSAGHCRKGHAAGRKSPTGEHLYFTPDEFFQRIGMAQEQLRCYKLSLPRGCLPTSLHVTYEEKLGFPTKLEDYSQNMSDYYWSLEVADIKVAP